MDDSTLKIIKQMDTLITEYIKGKAGLLYRMRIWMGDKKISAKEYEQEDIAADRIMDEIYQLRKFREKYLDLTAK